MSRRAGLARRPRNVPANRRAVLLADASCRRPLARRTPGQPSHRRGRQPRVYRHRAEVRDECSDLLWRRRDDPLVAVRDLHSSVTSRGAVAETHRFCTRTPGRGPARVTHGDLGGFAGVRQRTARPHRWLGPAPPGWPWPGRI